MALPKPWRKVPRACLGEHPSTSRTCPSSKSHKKRARCSGTWCLLCVWWISITFVVQRSSGGAQITIKSTCLKTSFSETCRSRRCQTDLTCSRKRSVTSIWCTTSTQVYLWIIWLILNCFGVILTILRPSLGVRACVK